MEEMALKEGLKEEVEQLMRQYDAEEIDRETYYESMMNLTSEYSPGK